MINNVLIAVLASSLALVGCYQAPDVAKTPGAAGAAAAPEATRAAGTAGAAGASEPAESPGEGLSLKPEEVAALGITTTAAQSIQSAPEVQGFGVVMPHDTIAIAVAEIKTAIAAENQSQAALARTKRLAGTPGALPAEIQETAARQAIADRAALELAKQKLSASLGLNLPRNAELLELASGRSKLVHVTVPLGSLGDTDPRSMRLGRIDASQGGKTWQTNTIWHAPADATVPGQSYFAILKTNDAGEGEHLLAWVPVGENENGVLVPASAAVISGGKFYCYVEEQPGSFSRTEFDPGRPVADGYFVKEGIEAGERIVTHAAGQLLARETNPSKEAD